MSQSRLQSIRISPIRSFNSSSLDLYDDCQTLLFLSRKSSPSTIESYRMTPRKQDSWISQDEDDICQEFEGKGYCQKGYQCSRTHRVTRLAETRKNLLNNYPELIAGNLSRRMNSFLQ